MNGTKVVFDTNALIHFFNGNVLLQKYIPSDLCISVVTFIEFLSFPYITQQEKNLLFDFVQDADLINLEFHNDAFIQQIVSVRSMYKIKLPDAIIAATAIFKDAVLVTNDKDFAKISLLKVSAY